MRIKKPLKNGITRIQTEGMVPGKLSASLEMEPFPLSGSEQDIN
jgi:hypothetical protein